MLDVYLMFTSIAPMLGAIQIYHYGAPLRQFQTHAIYLFSRQLFCTEVCFQGLTHDFNLPPILQKA